jgi:hypothetical protein
VTGTVQKFPHARQARCKARAGALFVLVVRIFRWPTWAAILAALALAAFAIVAIRSFREPVLRAAGRELVVSDDPVAPVDIIVVTLDSAGAGRSKRRTSCKAASQSESRFLWTLRVEKTMSSSAGASL